MNMHVVICWSILEINLLRRKFGIENEVIQLFLDALVSICKFFNLRDKT